MPGAPLPITTSIADARRERAAGRRVILIVASGRAGESVASAAGGGVHLFVGDPADPETQRAVAEMAAELGAVEHEGGCRVPPGDS